MSKSMRYEMNLINEGLGMLKKFVSEGREFQLGYEPHEDDEVEEIINQVDPDSNESIEQAAEEIAARYPDQAWMVVNPDTGEIYMDWEEEGGWQDARASIDDRRGYAPGELDAMDKKPEPEPEEVDDYDEPSGPSDEQLSQIADMIVTAAAESFPDGDPIDMLMPKLKRMGIDTYEIGDVLDQAAEAHLGTDYNGYLANLYDDFTADNPGTYDLDPNENPWNPMEESGADKTELEDPEDDVFAQINKDIEDSLEDGTDPDIVDYLVDEYPQYLDQNRAQSWVDEKAEELNQSARDAEEDWADQQVMRRQEDGLNEKRSLMEARTIKMLEPTISDAFRAWKRK